MSTDHPNRTNLYHTFLYTTKCYSECPNIGDDSKEYILLIRIFV